MKWINVCTERQPAVIQLGQTYVGRLLLPLSLPKMSSKNKEKQTNKFLQKMYYDELHELRSNQYATLSSHF
jgi:hypothetical protein